MHIEPGIVTGAKLALSYGTAAAAGAYGLRLAFQSAQEKGWTSLALRSVLTTALVFCFFEILPHFPVGVSEVHFILGSTLFLLFGAAPAAIGLALGLLAQGVLFAPFDLAQYGMNVTTLLVPLFGLSALANRIIAPGTAYVDLRYGQALALSTAYQGGVVAWVAFWAIFGQGIAGIGGVATFGIAYMAVILIEPLIDLAVLAAAKSMRALQGSALVTPRLFA
ncbi:energy-coupling factor ABC transporter permease [Paracoccus sp. Z330]|uniref:Energy-coupling factor ABC transporter permease n=1 Tax=Paracoccus onchidii TaxID=3017813 RepID=A0ABT4ZEH9_9RHOB|nr:energy-coupling factor ABC transporter permease [Paracoccus onchidii]MDB6177136.1 energy-coupling factor ABC transporter permease [Paracoccus onchidii]